MSPLSIIHLLCIVAFVTIEANPISHPNKEVEKASHSDQIATDVSLDLKPGKRQRRQGYFNPYEYYDSQSLYPSYGDYNYGAASAHRDYNYYSGYNPQSFYHRPSYYGNGNKKEKKYNNRRKYRPFEATSQKYTVWDLARK